MATLAEFLSTGQLGKIAAGASKDFVRKCLGEPADVSVQRNPEIWTYGALELSFYKGRGEGQPTLASLALYFREARARLPQALAWADWLPPVRTNLNVFQDWLATSGLNASVRVTGEDHEYLIMDSGVRVTFDDGVLDSIQFTVHRRSQWRQLSVPIPSEVWDRIREEAAQKKMSMSGLCSQWIIEQLKEPTATS